MFDIKVGGESRALVFGRTMNPGQPVSKADSFEQALEEVSRHDKLVAVHKSGDVFSREKLQEIVEEQRAAAAEAAERAEAARAKASSEEEDDDAGIIPEEVEFPPRNAGEAKMLKFLEEQGVSKEQWDEAGESYTERYEWAKQLFVDDEE